ncbi:MAG: DUF4934 domain-containing protein, partial [Tannerella sp.]|nr:DUF4934 domain-containing protein [Tannerella sp.]
MNAFCFLLRVINIFVKYGAAGIFFILFSCHYPGDEKKYPVIEIGKAMETVSGFTVSEIAQTITYVALETQDNCLIGRYPNMNVWKDNILISSLNQPLMVFSKKDGHFCRTIGHIGNDPGGYAKDGSGNISWWVDKTKGTVYFQDWNPTSLLKYDMEGNFLGKVTLSSEGTPAPSLSMSYLYISNDTVTIHNKYISQKEDPFLFRFNGTKGDLLSAFPFSREIQPSNIESINYIYSTYIFFGGGVYQIYFHENQMYTVTPNSPSLWEINGEMCLKESFIDTVYTVCPDALVPRILLNLGKWHWPYEKRNESDYSSNKIAIDYILENNSIIYFHFHTGLYESREYCHSYCGVYDKLSGQTKVMKGEAITDDVNGFLPVTIEKVSSE